MLKLLFISLSLSVVHTSIWANDSVDFTIMAAGGSLKTCSSLSRSNCKNTASLDKAGAKDEELYQVTQQSLNDMVKSEHWQAMNEQQLFQLAQLLFAFNKNYPEPLSRRQFTNTFRDSSLELPEYSQPIEGENFYRSMSDFDWYKMLDYLQVPQIEKGLRLKELVDLKNSKDEATEVVFESFVDMASSVKDPRRNKPLILFMTSSARDPYDAVDFYIQAFTQAGADVNWLPIDIAFTTALANDDCERLSAYRAELTGSVRREIIFPDLYQVQMDYCASPTKLIELIKDADGIFINGGDQALTRAALIDEQDTQFLSHMRKQVSKGELVIGGTSAGAAVQSGIELSGSRIPMITSGRSYEAVINGAHSVAPPTVGCSKNDSCGGVPENGLTYNKEGGLGFINTGIVDTHFSERARQLRLMQLAAETKAPIAVGVDETTAVIIAEDDQTITYRVIGKHGVWLFTEASLSENNGKTLTAISHYLKHNDVLTYNKVDQKIAVKFALQPNTETNGIDVENVEDILHRDSLRTMSSQLAQSKQDTIIVETKEDRPRLSIKLSKGEKFISASDLRNDTISQQDLSFTNLVITVSQSK